MRASVGDRLIIMGHAVGDPERDAEILEVRGADGGPPYVVRWEDSNHETLFFPGSDAEVQHVGEEPVALPSAPVGAAVRDADERLLVGVQRLLDAADALDESDVLPDIVHEVHALLEETVLPHLGAEATELYPVVDRLLGAKGATAPVLRQHLEIERLAARLGRLRTEASTGLTPANRRNLRQVLHALHALLVVHLAVDAELYVPLLEAKLSPRRSAELRDALAAAEEPAHRSLSTT